MRAPYYRSLYNEALNHRQAIIIRVTHMFSLLSLKSTCTQTDFLLPIAAPAIVGPRPTPKTNPIFWKHRCDHTFRYWFIKTRGPGRHPLSILAVHLTLYQNQANEGSQIPPPIYWNLLKTVFKSTRDEWRFSYIWKFIWGKRLNVEHPCS